MGKNEIICSQEEKARLESLAERVHEPGKEKKWPEEAFDAECKMHRTYVGAIERRERNVAVINLRKIAEALGVKVGELFE